MAGLSIMEAAAAAAAAVPVMVGGIGQGKHKVHICLAHTWGD